MKLVHKQPFKQGIVRGSIYYRGDAGMNFGIDVQNKEGAPDRQIIGVLAEVEWVMLIKGLLADHPELKEQIL